MCKVRCVSENNFGNGLMSFVVTSLNHASEEVIDMLNLKTSKKFKLFITLAHFIDFGKINFAKVL